MITLKTRLIVTYVNGDVNNSNDDGEYVNGYDENVA